MKTLLKSVPIRTFLIVLGVVLAQFCLAQTRPSIAIISLDTKDMELDNTSMAGLVRLELEKINKFEVLDRYDVQDVLAKNSIGDKDMFGKNAVIKAGKLLAADKMLTGSVERFASKIIFILRLIDVPSERIETTSVMEYQNVQNEIQTMAMISLNDLLGIQNDPHLVDLLINYNLPITTLRTTVSLNGPRMGAAFTTGENGKRLQATSTQGGYDMFPITSTFGYQFEKQYLSSGDFQALVEFIPVVSGLESGKFIPSIAFVNGFRFNKTGIEFGLGPNFRIVQLEDGFFQDGKWIRDRDVAEVPANVEVVRRLDNRGDLELSLGLIVGFGKTFRSGYLNIPVNLYLMPRKDGTITGISIGFNTTNKPKL